VLRRASLRYLVRHPLRFGLAALGIALGVALAVAIDVATVSVRRAFSLSSEAVVGDATHEIVGTGRPLGDELYRQLRLDAGLREHVALFPVVSGMAAVAGRPGEALQLIGIDPFAAAAERSETTGELGAFITQPGAAILGRATAARLGVTLGGHVPLQVGPTRRTVTVVGLAGSAGPRALADAALVDLATAQETLDLVGTLSRIEVRVRAGGDVTALARRLPAGVELQPAGARRGALAQLTRGFDLNLRALSLLGLFVGGFLIYNTITVAVAQRQAVLATLRTLGVTRAEVARLVLLESTLLGLLGAALGVALGVALGRGLVGLVARAVNDLYFAVSVTGVHVPALPLVRGGGLGVVVALLAALPAARSATQTEPRLGLVRSTREQRTRAHVARLAAAGVGCSLVTTVTLAVSGRSLPAAFAALVGLLIGAALLAPAALLGLSRLLAAPFGALGGLPGRMAARNTSRALSRTGVAVAALMLAISVSVGVSVMVSSFRQAVADWLGETLRADVYVSAPSLVSARADSPLPGDLVARLRGVAGVAELGSNRTVTVSTAYGPTLLLALDLGPRARAQQRLVARAPGVSDGEPLWQRLDHEDAVLVSEPFAYRHDVAPGAALTVTTASGPRPFRVLGVYRDYGSDAGSILISRPTYDRHFPDRAINAISLHAAPGLTSEALVARARDVVRPDEVLAIRSNQTLRTASLAVFDRTFEVTGVLRLLALIVAGLGVTGALMTLELERARELGTLRALGFTRGEVSRLLTLETGCLGFVAGVLAMPLGAALAALLVFAINRRSFGWTMPLSLAPTALLAAPALGLIAGLLGGLYPAWRLSRTAPSEALREE
jgi:putative ABC transport system permease protein